MERYRRGILSRIHHLLLSADKREIDWEKGHEFLDNELRSITHDAEIGIRYVDKLARVWRVDSKEEWVLIHVEVQTGREKAFAERMYVYNNRIYDKYRKRVVSFAVLADDSASWRPDRFGYRLWGCEVSLRYPVAKLIDWRSREKELLEAENIFGAVTLAHIRMLETRRDIPGRLRWKVILSQGLYELGYDQQQIEHLFRFIDWLMYLPEGINQQYYKVMTTYEETGRKRFVSIFEEMGMKKGMEKGREEGMNKGREEGLRQGIYTAIETMFGSIPESLQSKVEDLHSADQLKNLLSTILKAQSLAQVEEAVNSMRKNT